MALLHARLQRRRAGPAAWHLQVWHSTRVSACLSNMHARYLHYPPGASVEQHAHVNGRTKRRDWCDPRGIKCGIKCATSLALDWLPPMFRRCVTATLTCELFGKVSTVIYCKLFIFFIISVVQSENQLYFEKKTK